MSRDKAIPKLLDVFRHYGYEGATLARLSEATGLGKASLYHHFPKGKEEMAAVVLDYLNQGLNEQVLAPLRSDQPPASQIRAMNKNIDEFYCHGEADCLLALLSTGESHDLFGSQVKATLSLWIESLAAVAIKAGIAPKVARERAEDAVLQIQGALVLTRGLNDPAIFKRVLNRLPEMLLDSN
jgi:AcrR family transcriptional regulator